MIFYNLAVFCERVEPTVPPDINPLAIYYYFVL